MNKKNSNIIALKIKVEGLVQGIGFRPFIYKLAKKSRLNGYVLNLTDGVEIYVEGEKTAIEYFLSQLKKNAPEASDICSIVSRKIKPKILDDFEIRKSKDISHAITEISPDIAVCEHCLNDMQVQPHRINYPLINCINCGPRFTIIEDLPYDRKNTTMQHFEMCDTCKSEYEDILDRRFHAQPVACNTCGPAYQLISGKGIFYDIEKIIGSLSVLIDEGKIIAVKGTGGFHLMCNALDERAVRKLRHSKQREGKPFAVIFRNMEAVKRYAEVSLAEKKSLLSWKRPIVLLRLKKELAPSVTIGLNTIGAFLPYMPIHYLLFDKLNTPAVVLTSGNISDEPIIINNEIANLKLGEISDAFLSYNRDIHNRTDDSVVKIISNKERVFRRSRGYAPVPVKIKFSVDGILAAGAELVNCFCIGKGNQALLSQHIGDLKNLETYEFYTETIEKYKKLFRFKPTIVAYDMHPDYFSSKYATDLDLEKISIQHHHAHIASCMAEYKVDEPVIGICFDGTGYGTDGNIWGSEFFVADLKDFKRYTHFNYIALPGGDKVTEEPWRTAVSCLYTTYGKELLDIDIPFIHNLEMNKLSLVLQALEKKINCPLSSGAGRLFDAVAALLNICLYTTFHAEAPMKLESYAVAECEDRYDISLNKTISFVEMYHQIISDIQAKQPIEIIATKFHNTIIYTIFDIALKIRKETGLKKTVLSGGTFQNKFILERIEPLLIKHKFEVYTQSKVPCNDGGIALGQLVIAAKRRK